VQFSRRLPPIHRKFRASLDGCPHLSRIGLIMGFRTLQRVSAGRCTSNGGTCRAGVLVRSLPGCSKKMLTQTLREMERDRLIDRKVYPVVPPRVEYSLTPMGPPPHTVMPALRT
jgi:hypothetical protein